MLIPSNHSEAKFATETVYVVTSVIGDHSVHVSKGAAINTLAHTFTEAERVRFAIHVAPRTQRSVVDF